MRAYRELLRKWISGNFRASDERALQTFANQDPDLRESLEGYLQYPDRDHAAALERVRARVRGVHTERKVFFRTAYGKYSIAAAALFAVFGAWWLLRPNPSVQTELASVRIPPQSEGKATLSGIPDSVQLVEASRESETAAAVADVEHNAPDKSPSATTRPQPQTATNPVSPTAAPVQENQQNKSSQDAGVAYESAPAAMSVPTAGEDSERTRSSRSTNDARADDLNSPAPTAKSRVASKPTATAPKPEGVTFDTDKKATQAPEELPLEPKTGWNGWEAYLLHARNYPQEASVRNIRGSVRLTFQIDENGRPFQIRVARPLGFGCDEEAVRLLLEGPLWSPAGHKKGEVEIRFPR